MSVEQALNGPLAAFKEYPQFITWKAVWNEKSGKYDKFPTCTNTGDVVSAHETENRATHGAAVEAAARLGHGVGFVFTEHDPFFFLDLDKCVAPCGTRWSDDAMHYLSQFPGAAVEVSNSGSGLHVFGRCDMSVKHKCRSVYIPGAELYTHGRFVALTGLQMSGDASLDFAPMWPTFIEKHFQPIQTGEAVFSDEPHPDWAGPEDDDELIRRAMSSRSAKSVFSVGATFADLWECNTEILSRAYPDTGSQGRGYDASAVDRALAQHLAFWTGKHGERIQRLMLRSKLVREKWTQRDDYLQRTIESAVAAQRDVYQEKKVKLPPPSVEPRPLMATETKPKCEMRGGVQYLDPHRQAEHFDGCVYIQAEHGILVPTGDVLDQGQFRATYGGYSFALDSLGQKTTKSAWEAFTESQACDFPKVHRGSFDPTRGFGEIYVHGDRTCVNTYMPPNIKRTPGDITPFMEHVRKLIPDDNDRMILLCYMAACAQHQGVKFQWAPLIQGTEGNGKSLLTWVVEEAVGLKYSHKARADEIDSKFNAWVYGTIFAGIEDIRVTEKREHVMEILKPMITERRMEVQRKNKDQITLEICVNYLLNSNYKDAIRKTNNDRRFCTIFTAQQEAAHLIRDGMGGDYFPNLYKWLRDGGMEHVVDFLHTMVIPDELNPAKGAHRAPETTSTREAINLSTGSLEQEVLEAIETDRPGFSGGWVSSIQLSRLLRELRAERKVPQGKRHAFMKGLGYDYHPGLKNGRTNNRIALDDGKPTLFIRNGHPSARITAQADIAKAYEQAQTGATFPGH